MKKIVILLLLMTFFLSACSRNSSPDVSGTTNITNDTSSSSSYYFDVGQSMSEINKNYSPDFSINALSVYTLNGKYYVIIDDGNIVQKFVEFSYSRSCLNKQGLELISDYDIDQFLSRDINELAEDLGRYHVDIGSGAYIPSYITEDAKLISLYIEDDFVVDVVVRDLFSDEIIAQTWDS